MRQNDAASWLLIAAERHISGDTDALSTAFRRPISARLAPVVKGVAGPVNAEYWLVRTGASRRLSVPLLCIDFRP
jgi:hypothetical protein